MLTKIEMEFYNTLIANTKKQTDIYKEILEELKTLNNRLSNIIEKTDTKGEQLWATTTDQ